MSSRYLEVEPLTVSVSVEVRPKVELVVGVRDPDRLLQVAGLEPATNLLIEPITTLACYNRTCSRTAACRG